MNPTNGYQPELSRGAWENSLEGCEVRERYIKSTHRMLWLPGKRFNLANDWYNLGVSLEALGHFGPAEACFKCVPELLEKWRPVNPKKVLARGAVIAASYNHRGMLWLEQEEMEKAAVEFDRAIELRRGLLRRFANDRENQVYLGGALCNRGHSVADADPAAAAVFYEESLSILRRPKDHCECGYWDEERGTWWCSQVEALDDMLGLAWVGLAPRFIDNASKGLISLKKED